jgi:hypothetical protein
VRRTDVDAVDAAGVVLGAALLALLWRVEGLPREVGVGAVGAFALLVLAQVAARLAGVGRGWLKAAVAASLASGAVGAVVAGVLPLAAVAGAAAAWLALDAAYDLASDAPPPRLGLPVRLGDDAAVASAAGGRPVDADALASRTGLSTERVRRALEDLEAAGAARREGGRYRVDPDGRGPLSPLDSARALASRVVRPLRLLR